MPNVNVTYEEMRQAAKRLESGSTEMSNKLQELKNLVHSLVNGGYVTDASSKQFEQAYHDFNHGASQLMDGLNHMGAYLTHAADTFKDADAGLAAKLRQH